MVKEYIFSITEKSTGYVVVRSDHFPSEDEVMDEIHKGNACFDNTDYEQIKFMREEPAK